MQYEEIIEARDKVYLFLQQEGVANAGVGVGYSQNEQKPCLFIHLEHPLPYELSQKVQSNWPGTEVEVVGSAIAY
jgi:hypothetical protein